MIKKYNNYIKEDVQDDDIDYLNNLFSKEPYKNTDMDLDGEDIPVIKFKEGDRVKYSNKKSEFDGKKGIIVRRREGGKYIPQPSNSGHLSVRFDDGDIVALSDMQSVSDLRVIRPRNQVKTGRNEIWGPGAFDVPKSFFKNNVNFKEGDNIIYTKKNSEHFQKKGVFLKTREDGKCSIRLEDGTRVAASPNNIELNSKNNITKLDFYLKLGKLSDGTFGAFVISDKIEAKDIIKKFPELEFMEFENKDDNSISYKGDLSKEDLLFDLTERDFKATL